jgi:hypothetical protein
VAGANCVIGYPRANRRTNLGGAQADVRSALSAPSVYRCSMLRAMQRFRVIVVALSVLTLGRASAAIATTLDFSEPSVETLLTNTFVGSHVMHYSDPLTLFSLEGATFSASGAISSGSPYFYLRTIFDDRSPLSYAYDYIGGNVLQVASTGLDISFLAPVEAFSFGAALNSASSPSQMRVELFGVGNASLGVFSLALDRTVLSSAGGTNSNSEGRFVAPSVGLITAAHMTNLGDGTADGSEVQWVIDNVDFRSAASVPEATLLLLLGTGLLTAGARRWRIATCRDGAPSSRVGITKSLVTSRNQLTCGAAPHSRALG